MCSISVEPMPSRMSTPAFSLKVWAMRGGSASPAEVQARKACSPLFGNAGSASIAAYSVGTP